MSVNVPYLILGLVLLWLPRQWLRFGFVIGRKRRRGARTEPWKTRDPGDSRLTYGEFTKGRNYVDLLRAGIGALAIVGASYIDVRLAFVESAGAPAKSVLFAKVAILLVGLLIQTVRYERRRISFFAPVFYLAGLSLALCGPWAALFAFLLVWAINSMFGNAEAFLFVYGVLLVAFGILFHATTRLLPIAACGLCLVPVLLSLLTRRPLVVFTRKASSGTHG